MEERIVKKLMASVRCNQCGQPYRLENIQILGSHNDMWFFNVYCNSCHSQYFIAATVVADKSSIVTDLTPSDITRLQKANPLTSDDVLDMHSHLKNYSGDITHLFNTKTFNV